MSGIPAHPARRSCCQLSGPCYCIILLGGWVSPGSPRERRPIDGDYDSYSARRRDLLLIPLHIYEGSHSLRGEWESCRQGDKVGPTTATYKKQAKTFSAPLVFAPWFNTSMWHSLSLSWFGESHTLWIFVPFLQKACRSLCKVRQGFYWHVTKRVVFMYVYTYIWTLGRNQHLGSEW
jgi:hypothetical protein